MKYSEQFKLAVVQHYLAGTAGFNKVAQHFGIASPMLRGWVSRYRLHGLEGLSKKRGHYSAEFKLSVLQHMWENGLSYRQTAAVFNIANDTSIADWERRYQSGGIENLALRRGANGTMKAPTTKPTPAPGGEDKRSREELLDRLEYLEAENAYLKKRKALLDAKNSTAPKKRK